MIPPLIVELATRSGSHLALHSLTMTTERMWTILLVSLLISMAAALAGTAALALIRRDRRRLGPLTRQLARNLGLDRSQCRAMQRVARAAGLPTAASMLISRGCFDAAVRSATPDETRMATLAGIRTDVFAAEDA